MRTVLELLVSFLTIGAAVLVAVQGGPTSVDNELEASEKLVLDVPKCLNFVEFVNKFHKDYQPIEALAKAKIFLTRTMQIFRHNVNFMGQKVSHYLSQNEYIDLSSGEAREALLAKGSELSPVSGASVMPDMPAEDYYRQTEHGDLPTGFTRGLSSDDSDSFGEASSPSVDFFGGLSDENQEAIGVELRDLISGLRSDERTAKVASMLVNLRSPGDRLNMTEVRQQMGIVEQLNPAYENPHFDRSLIPTKSSAPSATRFNEAFMNLLVNDFSENLDPYPAPQAPREPVLSDSDEQPRSVVINGLLSFVRNVYGVFSESDEEKADELADATSTTVTAAANPASSDGSPPESVLQLLGRLHNEQLNLLRNGPVKYDIDWQRTGCVQKPKSQLNCNACYVFAALDLMQFLYCLQTNRSTEFSTQYVVDCGYKSNLNGCQGGKLSDVGIFIMKYGIQSSAVYPYVGEVQQCPYDAKDDAQQKSFMLKPTITRWQLFDDIKAWYDWLPKTPLIVGINMPADFLAYGGGIHEGQNCVPGMAHAMVLVGSGVQNGKTFWLLKNTFSYSWGEAGYFRLSKRAPMKCFNSAILARAKFVNPI